MCGGRGRQDGLLITGMAGSAGRRHVHGRRRISRYARNAILRHQIALERAELAEYPEAEAEELALIYNARGLDMDEAPRQQDHARQPEHASKSWARGTGLNPDDLVADRAALSSFSRSPWAPRFPLPFFAGLVGREAIYVAAAVTVCAVRHRVILSLFTGHSGLRGGLRLVVIGGGAGLAAWGVGKLLGAGFA